MNRLLIAVALAALSTPALARGEPGPDYHHYVQPRSEQHQRQSQTGNSQTNDPYWQPCDYSDSNSEVNPLCE